jgi:O-antigen ligase
MFLKKFVDIIKAEPLVFLLGACVLVLAVMGTSVRHVSSTMSAIVFLLSFLVIKDWAKLYLSLPKLEKIFLFSLLFYTVSAAFSYYNAGDADRYFKLFDHYLRFTLIIPVYLLIIKNNISILNYLLTGAVVSGPFLFFIALSSYLSNPDVPAQGYYHHIIFGQLAMLNVGIMLCMLLTKNFDRYMQVLIMFSMLLGLVAAVMSQARGVWLVFPVYMMVAIYYTVKDKYLSINHVVIFLVVAVLLSVVSPIGDLIKQRSEMAVTEVTRFYTEDHYVSSVGTRLAMWDIAVDVWKKNPVLGTGPGDFDDEVMALQKQGEYVGMDVHNSVHNIFFQALVDSGIVGLMALLFAVIIMPLKVFLGNPDKEGRLVGIITVVSFAVFGMSESWTLRSSSISMFLVYIVVITSHMHVVQSKK